MLYPTLQSLCDWLYPLAWNRITPEYLLASLLVLFISLLAGFLFRRRYGLTCVQILAGCLLLFYLVLLIGGAVVCRRTRSTYTYILRPFWSYTVADPRGPTARGMILRNCLMLFPLGLLLPLSLPRKNIRFKTVVIVSVLFAYGIEFSQLFLKKGNFELVDDPFHNVIGAMLGYAVYLFLRKINKVIQKR